jgi:hypothetical protein
MNMGKGHDQLWERVKSAVKAAEKTKEKSFIVVNGKRYYQFRVGDVIRRKPVEE